MSGVIDESPSPPPPPASYDYVMTDLGQRQQQQHGGRDPAYHYYADLDYYEDVDKKAVVPVPAVTNADRNRHKPISEDDARLLRLEHLAEVSAHRMDRLERQPPERKETVVKVKQKNKIICMLLLGLVLCYGAVIASLVMLYNHSFEDEAARQDPRAQFYGGGCQHAFLNSSREAPNGVYLVSLDPAGDPFSASAVRCHMSHPDPDVDAALGGGWTVVQRRGQYGNPINYFSRDWDEYSRGFGELTGEFWMGLEAMAKLTASKEHELAILLREVEDDGKTIYARYSSIGLSGPDFSLTLGPHSGTAGDPLSRFGGAAFSTPDRDNDRSSRGHCAKKYSSGWWFASCGTSNLNGANFASAEAPPAEGVVFSDSRHPFTYSFREAQMMVRPLPAARRLPDVVDDKL